MKNIRAVFYRSRKGAGYVKPPVHLTQRMGLVAFCGWMLPFALVVSRLQASTLIVENLNDSGPGSLRQAIATAASQDTISCNVTGTVSLISGQLVVTNDLIIAGPGADRLWVSGNNISRVFQICSNVTVYISDITICEGYASDPCGECVCSSQLALGFPGGGIYNAGQLSLARCTLRDNRGGLGATTFDYRPYCGWWADPGGSGGAIYNASALSAVACTFTGNAAGAGGHGGYFWFNCDPFYAETANAGADGGSGGAILNEGTMSLTNCTITGNVSGDGGEAGLVILDITAPYCSGACGGSAGNGGGICNLGSLYLVACTVAANRTGSGGAATCLESTVCPGADGLGGGIYNADGAFAQPLNTIIADNGGSAAPDVAGAFFSGGHNLVERYNGAFGFTNGTGFDLVGTVIHPLNPQLSQLQNNGGPTFTMNLLRGSAALDAGDDALLWPPYDVTTDQRGFPRRSGPHVDIGAVESDECTLLCSTNIHVCNDPGQCGAIVHFDPPIATNCDAFVITCLPPSGSFFQVGTNIVSCTAADLAPGSFTNICTFLVTVSDCEPPVIHSIRATPASLWPPDHTMQPVTLHVSATDNCHVARCKIISVASNESDRNDEHDTDWEITGDLTIKLRAERAGHHEDRVYSLTVESADDWGNTTRAVINIPVRDER